MTAVAVMNVSHYGLRSFAVWSCSLDSTLGLSSRLIFIIILFLHPSQNWCLAGRMALILRSMFVIVSYKDGQYCTL